MPAMRVFSTTWMATLSTMFSLRPAASLAMLCVEKGELGAGVERESDLIVSFHAIENF